MKQYSDGIAGRRAPAGPADLALGVVGIFAGLCAAASLFLPFGWDQGIMAAVGETMLRGGVPYRDGWDLKGPLSFAPFAALQALFGPEMWPIRLFDLVVMAPAAVAVGRAVARRGVARDGVWAALALYLWWISVGWFHNAQPDLWVGALAALAFSSLIGASPPTVRQLLLAGLVVGASGLVKPFYLCLGAAPLAAVLLTPGLALADRARMTAILCAASAAPLIVVGAWFQAHGALGEAIDVHLLYSLQVYADPAAGLKRAALGIRDFLMRGPVALVVPLALLGLWSLRGDRKAAGVMIAWTLATGFCVVLQGKYYTYQWLPLYAPLLLLGALGVQSMARSASGVGQAPAAAALLTAAFLAQAAAPAALELAIFGRTLAKGGDWLQAYHDRHDEWLFNAGDQRRAARYLKAHTRADDRIFVWGNDSGLYVLTGRANPTRFTVNMPLVYDGPYRDGYQAETLAALTRAPPAYVVVGLPFETPDKAVSLARFPGFARFLADGYVLDRRIGNLDLYRRR